MTGCHWQPRWSLNELGGLRATLANQRGWFGKAEHCAAAGTVWKARASWYYVQWPTVSESFWYCLNAYVHVAGGLASSLDINVAFSKLSILIGNLKLELEAA